MDNIEQSPKSVDFMDDQEERNVEVVSETGPDPTGNPTSTTDLLTEPATPMTALPGTVHDRRPR